VNIFGKIPQTNDGRCNAHWILNLEDTGFESLKRGRLHSRKVFLARGHAGQPTFMEIVESHFVTAISIMSRTEDVLRRDMIAAMTPNHVSGINLPYFQGIRKYTPGRHLSPASFLRNR
jgi:hypothetical protein